MLSCSSNTRQVKEDYPRLSSPKYVILSSSSLMIPREGMALFLQQTDTACVRYARAGKDAPRYANLFSTISG